MANTTEQLVALIRKKHQVLVQLRETGRRHWPAYYERLNASAACACFGGYYVTGLSRPTDGSIMRILGKPFNLPGVEAMIAGFYRHASIATPGVSTARTLRPSDTARVVVPRLAWVAYNCG